MRVFTRESVEGGGVTQWRHLPVSGPLTAQPGAECQHMVINDPDGFFMSGD